jgi:rubredoxin
MLMIKELSFVNDETGEVLLFDWKCPECNHLNDGEDGNKLYADDSRYRQIECEECGYIETLEQWKIY